MKSKRQLTLILQPLKVLLLTNIHRFVVLTDSRATVRCFAPIHNDALAADGLYFLHFAAGT